MKNLLSKASAFLVVSCLLYQLHESEAHGTARFPNPRGGLKNMQCRRNWIANTVDSQAEVDCRIHYPAGDKSDDRGSGIRSQIAAADSRGWIPFDPTNPSYHWRYGVCGDLKSKRDHLRGGKFYNGGQISATYNQGQTISVEMTIVIHHGGFALLHMCDVSKCGGEISEDCFKTPGACHLLERDEVPECEDNRSDQCSPIDPRFPGRWYLPCSRQPGEEFDVYGPRTMQFKLPKRLSCDHCVLHWHWETANICNPTDFVRYFTGPFGPNAWNGCKVDGMVSGGYNANRPDCGRDRQGKVHYTEDYAWCSDVRIERADIPDPVTTSRPSPSGTPRRSPLPPPVARGPVKILGIAIVKNNRQVRFITPSCVIHIGTDTQFTLEAVTSKNVNSVSFFVNNKLVRTTNRLPFYIGGSARASVWDEVRKYSNKAFDLEVVASNTQTGQKATSKMRLFLKT